MRGCLALGEETALDSPGLFLPPFQGSSDSPMITRGCAPLALGFVLPVFQARGGERTTAAGLA
jgi:hypothetical protein